MGWKLRLVKCLAEPRLFVGPGCDIGETIKAIVVIDQDVAQQGSMISAVWRSHGELEWVLWSLRLQHGQYRSANITGIKGRI